MLRYLPQSRLWRHRASEAGLRRRGL